MPQTYRESSRSSHSNEVEHRFTTLEIEVSHMKKDQGKVNRDHGRRITALEGGRQKWTPRDITLAGAGIAMVAAALAEKVGWMPMFAAMVRLYGAK